MAEYTCDMCNHAIIDREYFLIIRGVPITSMVVMCSCDEVKDKYYNRFIRQKKIRVDARNETPPLIGNAHDYCRGIYFKETNKSVFEYNEED